MDGEPASAGFSVFGPVKAAMATSFLPNELDYMVYWIKQRELIRQAKEKGLSKPWTYDALLRDYRWCNVRRMDDRVSRELMDKWYRHRVGPDEALVAATLARYINRTDTLMEISGGQPFFLSHLKTASATLHARTARGQPVFTGAYMIPGVPGKLKANTVPAVAEAVLAAGAYRDTQRGTWEQLIKINGLGSFLAGQIVADVAWLSVGLDWPDRETWAPVGPGSARGINRLIGRPKDLSVGQAMFDQLLPPLMKVLRSRVPEIWEDRKLVAMDCQSLACEFDKYRRLMLKEGQVKARYPG